MKDLTSQDKRQNKPKKLSFGQVSLERTDARTCVSCQKIFADRNMCLLYMRSFVAPTVMISIAKPFIHKKTRLFRFHLRNCLFLQKSFRYARNDSNT